MNIDSDSALSSHFMPHQVRWILDEETIHAQNKQAFAVAEKSVRIGWTYADAYKNVRKRLRFKKRDYLFATKDLPSALEYMSQVYEFANLFNLTGTIVSHGEEYLKVPRTDEFGRKGPFTDEMKIGVIKFDTGSRIIAFSAHPQAMAVYGGDVGLDEFAKHPNAAALWETAQGRVTWGYDMAIWSSHDGEDTLFNEFAREARSGKGPWNLYYRVTLSDAIASGLVDAINRARGTHFTPDQFTADCQARARTDETFQQAYMCNPLGASAARLVEWSAIERCRSDFPIERLHLESAEILSLFGQFDPASRARREERIEDFLRQKFRALFNPSGPAKQPEPPYYYPPSLPPAPQRALGFDVAASGDGDLAAIYIDEVKGDDHTLRALFTCRTEDWHFLKSVLFCFLHNVRNLQAAGDESGLGRQICWEAANHFFGTFTSVNLASKKHDLGFALMNQLTVAQKRFPKSEQDIAADFFALRKRHTGTRWVFTETRNPYNLASHCDIAWAAALASHAITETQYQAGAWVG